MLKEKVDVITGGASGIGLGTAKKLLSEGANVVLVDWNEDVSRIAENLNERALGIRCDVSSDTDVKKCVEDIIKKYGHINYLVANAGIGGGPNKAHEVSIDEWNKVIGVNQTGIFLINIYVIKNMLENGGGARVNGTSRYRLVV